MPMTPAPDTSRSPDFRSARYVTTTRTSGWVGPLRYAPRRPGPPMPIDTSGRDLKPCDSPRS